MHIRSYHYNLITPNIDSNNNTAGYFLQRIEIIADETTNLCLPKEIYYFGTDDPQSNIKIDKLITDIARKSQSDKEKEQGKKNLFVVMPKTFHFGETIPTAISRKEYMENFSCFKLDPEMIIKFFVKSMEVKISLFG